MVEFKSYQMFLILMIPFTAVTQHRSFITVRVGDEAILPCEDVRDYRNKCPSTTWIFKYLTTGPAVTLFEYGQIPREAAAKSDRLSVTEKCSLVIKKVTDEDAGRYNCRQYDESGQLVTYSDIYLTVNYRAVTQHYSSITVRVRDEATLPCEDVKDYQDKCQSTTWTFSHSANRPALTLFEYGKFKKEAAAKSDRLSVTEKCSLVIKKITDEDAGHYTCKQFDEEQTVTDSQVELSVDKRDNVAIPPPPTTTKLPTTTKRTTKLPTTTKQTTKLPTTTKRTTKLPTTTKQTTKLPTTTKRTTKATKATTRSTKTKATRATARPTTTTTTDPAAGETSPNADLLKVLIPVAIVSAALLIIVVVVIRWKRAKGNNTRLDDNTADPPDGVSYASIRYKKKTKSKARVQGEDDMVTYSTLNTFSTSAGASTDPRRLYASINKTNT